MDDYAARSRKVAQYAAIGIATFLWGRVIYAGIQSFIRNPKIPIAATTVGMIILVAMALYGTYVARLLYREFSPRSIRHLSAVLVFIIWSGIWTTLKLFPPPRGSIDAVVQLSLPLLMYCFYRVCCGVIEKSMEVEDHKGSDNLTRGST